ncbi:MAG: sugar ABC transporter substrate-binding protein [Spirochaetota bacterium]
MLEKKNLFQVLIVFLMFNISMLFAGGQREIPTDIKGQEIVQLRFFFPGGRGRDEAYGALVAEFETVHPTVKIEIQTAPYADYFAQLPVMWTSNNPADIVLVDSPDVKAYAYNEAIVPLGDVFSAEDLSDFARSIVSELKFKNELYAGPVEESAIAVYYNKDLFQQAGIVVPERLDNAWTWPEFVKNVQKVIEDNSAQGKANLWGLVFLGNPPVSDYWSIPFIRSMGKPGSPTFTGISSDGTRISGFADTEEAYRAYQFWQDIYNRWKLAPKETIPDAFGSGKAVTMISFPAWGSRLTKNFPGLNWGVMPLPYHNTPITHTGGFALAVSRKSKHIKEAKEFIQYVTSPKGFMKYYSISSIMPARKSLLDSIDDFQKGSLRVFRDELIEWGYPRPEGPGHDIYNSMISKMMIDIAKGADIGEIVPATVQAIDRQLSRFK